MRPRKSFDDDGLALGAGRDADEDASDDDDGDDDGDGDGDDAFSIEVDAELTLAGAVEVRGAFLQLAATIEIAQTRAMARSEVMRTRTK